MGVAEQSSQNSPEQRVKRVEALLQEAAHWEPERNAPENLVRRALQNLEQNTRQETKRRIPAVPGRGWLAGSDKKTIKCLFVSVGVQSTVFAATILLAMNGQLPFFSRSQTVSSTVTEKMAPLASRSNRPVFPEKQTHLRTEFALKTSSFAGETAPIRMTTGLVQPATLRVQQASTRTGLRLRAAASATIGGEEPTASLSLPDTAQLELSSNRATTVRLASATQLALHETVDANETILEIDVADAPSSNTLPQTMFVPVVLSRPSYDGMEITYTPAVVEVAYRP